jgi:hypothetical protein
LAALLSLTIGPMDLSPGEVLRVLAANAGLTPAEHSQAQQIVVWDIRLSRALLGVLVGAGLAMAGAAMQGVFRNPLADPGIIGVSGGGAMGAILMIIVGGRLLADVPGVAIRLYAVPVAAMAGAVATTWLIYRISLRRGQVDVVSMLPRGSRSTRWALLDRAVDFRRDRRGTAHNDLLGPRLPRPGQLEPAPAGAAVHRTGPAASAPPRPLPQRAAAR